MDRVQIVRQLIKLAEELLLEDFEFHKQAAAESFKKDPEKWRKFWKSLTGDAKHKMTKCIEKVKDWADNPEAFCAALKDFVEGTTEWRKGRSK